MNVAEGATIVSIPVLVNLRLGAMDRIEEGAIAYWSQFLFW